MQCYVSTASDILVDNEWCMDCLHLFEKCLLMETYVLFISLEKQTD